MPGGRPGECLPYESRANESRKYFRTNRGGADGLVLAWTGVHDRAGSTQCPASFETPTRNLIALSRASLVKVLEGMRSAHVIGPIQHKGVPLRPLRFPADSFHRKGR